MEVCAKLESFLEEHELNNIPEIAKRKISDKFSDLNQLITDLKNEKSELNAILDRQQFEFEKEVASYQQKLEESTESCTKLKAQISELEGNLTSVQKEWRDLQKLHDSSMLEFQATKRENEVLNQEKKNLAEQLEKRRADIEKLNGDIKSLLEQTTAANEAKFEAIAAAEEAKMKESNLQHQVTRLEQEKELLNRQIADLNSELTQKNHEIHTLKREKSNNILDLKTQLENRADEIHLLQKKLDCLKENLEEKDSRIEALAEKIRQLNQSHTKAEEQFNLELNAQSKLIDLHKKASEDNQQRVQELMRAFEEAQKLLKESNESCEEMERHCQNVDIKCKEQLDEKQNEINLLREELRKAKDLAHGLNKDAIEKIFPVAAATSKVLHSGMTLTELYVEYTRLQEELQQQKNENSSVSQQLKHLVAEIEEKTPLINQRMLEYEKSKDTISCLKSQLANALADYEKLLEERNDAKRISNLAERENARLKTQVVDLNRQVQVLLKEVEEARGGRIRNGSSRIHEDDVVTSSDDVLTADKIISRHLVTFRDIEEIQSKNQKLLAAIRDLSQQHEEMEKKLSSELSEKFKKDIEALTSELEDLQQKRTKQSEMLETIIRQRDMYRVLLTSQGFSESLLGQPDGSLSVLQNSSKLSPGDPRLKEAKTAMNQLQAEFNNYKKEKNENARMLNEQLDKMRSDVSDLRIQNAKLASQCEYSEERVKLLQSNLDTYKKEYMSFKEKNRQHSSMIIQHQQTINSLRQDLMVAQEKLAKADVTVENLKAERDLLKNVETRLLQERESLMKEQQQQSRLMANLQAVQNNLERIESETKRNLQYQVEKLEKENSILGTKVDNANEEYRTAVKIWEKQNKELQQKVDAEVERNRKLHEDLVDAYSQVHALNQDLLNTKAQIPEIPEKPAADTPKTPAKAPEAGLSAAEVKQLKEQLNETQMKLKSLQEKFDITSKSTEQYLNMCRDLEIRVKEQDEINKQLQESMNSALSSSKEAQTSLEKNLENMEKTNRELVEENMKLTQNSGSQVNELQQKISELVKSIENYKNQAHVSKETADQARIDCQNQIKLMQDVQEKYERELVQHAQDIQAMSALKEEHQNCSDKMEKLTEATKIAEQTLAESRESWSRQEEIFVKETEALKQRLKDLEECNRNLHEQLDMMGTQMAALQSKNWDETPYASIQSDLKDTQHLLQVIQFIKKEKEIASTQYDLAQSENVRLNLKVEQLMNELNETKAELKEVMSNFQAKATSEAQHTDLLKKVEMMNLLTESNNLLRMEKESLSTAKSELEKQLHELEEKLQPLIEKEREMSQQNDLLSAENNALRIEVKSWQSRTNQLLEQSHRIGPQEYKNLMREIEELKNQKERLAEELQKKQAEVSQITANSNSLKKELENTRKTVQEKTLEIKKLSDDIAEHHKTLLQIKKIGRKYKTQYDELKVKYDDLVAKSKPVDVASQEQTLQEIQRKLEESEKSVKDLKVEVEKEKESSNLAKQAQTKANEKEERAIKLLSQFRQKYAQVNNQKEALTEENKKLIKEVDELKSQISNLMLSQEENNQNKSQYDVIIGRLEKELRVAKELRISEREFLTKQYEELCQKIQQNKAIKPSIGLGDRASCSSGEPLTANIKPLTSPSTSGVSPTLRHSPHPHAATAVSRPTPTASIRPMAIGTASAATPTQTRMAAVLPTTATPPHTEEESVFVASTTPTVSVPHPVQPLVQPSPATATVAPTTMAVTVSPVISDVSTPNVNEPANIEEEHRSEALQAHVIGIPVATTPVTALVTPRIDVTDMSSLEPVTADSPAPTTSVIVSPPATQVVAPTVKRPREESPGGSDVQESSLKRVRMVSEGSQTNQHSPASASSQHSSAPAAMQQHSPTPPSLQPHTATSATVQQHSASPPTLQQHSTAPTSTSSSNVAVVPAAQVVPLNKAQDAPVSESHLTVPSIPIETKETPVAVIASAQPSTSAVIDESVVPTTETTEAEILGEDEKDEQNIEWEPQDDVKIEDDYVEGMEEEPVIDETEELEEDEEQMQGIDAKSPVDEDMSEGQQEEEEMADQSNPSGDIDLLDGTSDIQMDADSSSLQTAPSGQCMAPPAYPPTLEVATRADAPPQIEAISAAVQQSSVPIGPPRLDRQTPVSRQHLTPFTIPGQGSNFEEGDDSIVPSTPTLYVPRRTDGFAEAVSSPHVPQVTFVFSSSGSSPTQQSYVQSQLASQGALGVDDTRMDLFDEGSSRTVPTTPLQVSPPTDATVPEVSEQVSEATANKEVPAVEIKIDFAEESSETNVAASISKEPAESASSLDVEASKEEKPESSEQKTETTPTEPSTSADAAKESSVADNQSLEEASKSEDTQEADQSKDGATAQPSQRKPIVWSKDATESPNTSDSTTAPTSQGLLVPPRGRARARRVRYAAAPPYAARGRGEASWGSPARRGRGTARRRSMY